MVLMSHIIVPMMVPSYHFYLLFKLIYIKNQIVPISHWIIPTSHTMIFISHLVPIEWVPYPQKLR
jgi:hypothetical protein